MPHDPSRVENTRHWLEKAKTDLIGADWNLKAKPPLREFALFHAQQASEKSMKAFLFWHDVPFQKTHDLRKLGELCCKTDPTLSEVTEKAVPLTSFAVQFRYPEEDTPPTAKETKSGISIAKKVFKAVTARLPKECSPKDK